MVSLLCNRPLVAHSVSCSALVASHRFFSLGFLLFVFPRSSIIHVIDNSKVRLLGLHCTALLILYYCIMKSHPPPCRDNPGVMTNSGVASGTFKIAWTNGPVTPWSFRLPSL